MTETILFITIAFLYKRYYGAEKAYNKLRDEIHG